jgi:hypothetical protein
VIEFGDRPIARCVRRRTIRVVPEDTVDPKLRIAPEVDPLVPLLILLLFLVHFASLLVHRLDRGVADLLGEPEIGIEVGFDVVDIVEVELHRRDFERRPLLRVVRERLELEALADGRRDEEKRRDRRHDPVGVESLEVHRGMIWGAVGRPRVDRLTSP